MSAAWIQSVDKIATLTDLSQFQLPPDAILVFGVSGLEQRSQAVVWQHVSTQYPNRCIAIDSDPDPTQFSAVQFSCSSLDSQVDLNSPASLWSNLPLAEHAFIDITGLSTGVWAPIIVSAMRTYKKVSAIYIEPLSYQKNPAPFESNDFALSKAIRGRSPIPGFKRLSSTTNKNSVLVLLLGFEGSRAATIATEVESTQTFAIVGVPGFQLKFPSYTVTGNTSLLREKIAYMEFALVAAHDPFELHDTLESIFCSFREPHMYVAPIGTKPHALGAVIFAMRHREHVELIYDHPVRSSNRSSGIGRVHVYSVQ